MVLVWLILPALVFLATDRVREGLRALTGQAPPPAVAVALRGDRLAVRVFDLRLSVPYPRRAVLRLAAQVWRWPLALLRGAPIVGWPGRLDGP